MCRGQSYNHAGKRRKLLQKIKAIETKALYLHCYGHSFNLAMSGTIHTDTNYLVNV